MLLNDLIRPWSKDPSQIQVERMPWVPGWNSARDYDHPLSSIEIKHSVNELSFVFSQVFSHQILNISFTNYLT